RYSLTGSRPRSPSNVETLEAVDDEKENALVYFVAAHDCCSVIAASFPPRVSLKENTEPLFVKAPRFHS
ncbi:15.7 kDa heat shock protein peroxisomal, partial [Dissostichus eleginoides]